ncbi:MAG: hypothetical protein AB7I33_11925 [Gemmatimonadales bacterium]
MAAGCQRLVLGVALSVTVSSGLPAQQASPAREGFERLKLLAGTWSFTMGGERGLVSYEVASDGSLILERVINGEHAGAGMVSAIFLDGDRLVMHHYCGAGNQPVLVSTGLEGDELRFTFAGGTNLADGSVGHIHGARFMFQEEGSFESEWTWMEAGKASAAVRRHRVAGSPGRR